MADGSDAIADWPLLNALVSTASGASWVSIHHGGGVGIGRSIHAGQVTVADGTELAAQKVERVLTNDPAMGVLRHVDAGYPEAERAASGRAPADPDERSDGSGRAPEATHEDSACSPPTPAGSPPPGRSWPASAGTGCAAGTPGTPSTTPRCSCGNGSPSRRSAAGLEVENDRNGNVWAWWGAPGTGRGRHRVAPGLGARRRRLRRSARRRLRRCSPSTSCGCAGSAARPAARDRLLRRGGGRPVRHALHGFSAADRRHRRGPGAPAA